MNDNLKSIVNQLFGDGYFIINSMYFDKPGRSTWGVPYHQDRQIIVAEKKEVNGFNEWFNNFGLLTVRATNEVLQQIYTIRIHFDETNIENGSLQVIESSHKQGIFDPRLIDKTKEVNCNVPVGGVMIMSPLLMHQSLASSSDTKRRVIHFNSQK
jgi:ectoine hydroxylase-related dioxygenase (phytanoyl-CoA dioxygenase family)